MRVVFDLIKIEWLKAVRSPQFHKNLFTNIMMWLSILYFIGMFLFFGVFLKDILLGIKTESLPIDMVFGGGLYIMIVGICFRFMVQKLQTTNIKHYQLLPIKRNTLVNYLILMPVVNPVNYMLMLIIVPFIISSLNSTDIFLWQAFTFFIVFNCIIWFNYFISILLKRRMAGISFGFGILLIVALLIGGLEYFKIFSTYALSMTIFRFLVLNPFGFIVMIGLVVGAFYMNRYFFDKNYYLESFEDKDKFKLGGYNIAFISKLGLIGEFINIHVKLIFRHKRTKSVLWTALVFLFYGLIFYTVDAYQADKGLIYFVALFTTSPLTMFFGGWLISINGDHFDCLMTRRFNVREYITANYYMLVFANIATFILTTPYFFFGKDVILFHISAFLYNIGVNLVLLLILAPLMAKKLKLSEGSAMSYQGTTYKHFLVLIPLMFLPWIVVSVFNTFGLYQEAVIGLGLFGILGIVFHRWLLIFAERTFLDRKYKLSESFRSGE